MKTSGILAVAAGAALAAAQLNQIPTCALSCAITSLGATGCDQTNIACICQASSFLTGILSCIQSTCTPAEIEKTLGAAQVLCAQAGVTITVPGGPEPTTTTAAPEPETTTTAAPEPEPTTTEELTTAPGLSTTSQEPEPTTTEAPAETTTEVTAPTYGITSDVVTLTTTTTICPSSTHEVPTYVPPPAQNTTVAVPPPAYTGAAGNVAANAGTLLIGAALAMFFA